MTKKEGLTGVFALLLVIGIAWLGLTTIGLNRAPDIVFKIIDGRQIELKKLQGQPVLVTFWSTTCSRCIKEMPNLIALYNELSGDGLEIIGVAMAYDPPNQVLEMTKRRQIPYPIALDIDGSTAKAFGRIMLTPTSFLIAPDGKILQYRIGELNIDKLRKQIENLLTQQSQVTSHKSQGAFDNNEV